MPGTVLHVRLDTDLLQRIEALANELRVDRSVAVRTLLASALGDPAMRMAQREAMMLLSKQRKLLLAKFSLAITGLAEDTLRETELDG